MTDEHVWGLLQGLNTKVDSLQNTVTAFVARQETICANQRERAAALAVDFYGNGKPGIKKAVEELQASENFRRKVVAAAVGLIISNIGTIISFSIAMRKMLQ